MLHSAAAASSSRVIVSVSVYECYGILARPSIYCDSPSSSDIAVAIRGPDLELDQTCA